MYYAEKRGRVVLVFCPLHAVCGGNMLAYLFYVHAVLQLGGVCMLVSMPLLTCIIPRLLHFSYCCIDVNNILHPCILLCNGHCTTSP